MTTDNTLQNLSMNSTIDANMVNYSGWYDWGTWYPSYPTVTYIREEKNSFETSFKIVSKLLEKKIIEKLTLKQFIELVNEVAKLV